MDNANEQPETMTNPVASWAMSLPQPPSGERGGTNPAHLTATVKPALAEKSHGKARRGNIPRARPFQRAGRPGDGHLKADAERVSGCIGKRISFHPADDGLDVVESIKAMYAGKTKI